MRLWQDTIEFVQDFIDGSGYAVDNTFGLAQDLIDGLVDFDEVCADDEDREPKPDVDDPDTVPYSEDEPEEEDED